MAELDLEYLKDPAFIGFGSDIFRSGIRLPIMGAMIELAPVLGEDEFYLGQIISVAGTDPGNTTNELKRVERSNMIRRLARTGKVVNYVREPSPRWDIFEVALRAAKEEVFGIVPEELE